MIGYFEDKAILHNLLKVHHTVFLELLRHQTLFDPIHIPPRHMFEFISFIFLELFPYFLEKFNLINYIGHKFISQDDVKVVKETLYLIWLIFLHDFQLKGFDNGFIKF